MTLNLSIFKNKSFRLLWLSTLLSGLSDSMFMIALTLMVVKTTGSGAVLGALLMAIGIPHMVLTVIGGVVVDRFNPRKVLTVTYALRAAVMGFLLLLAWQGQGVPPIWALFVMAVAFGSVDAFEWPAATAVRQRLVAKEMYVQSYSLLAMAFQLSAVLGPMAGAFLAAGGDYWLVFGVNGMSFLFAMGSMMKIQLQDARVETTSPQKKTSFLTDTLEGFRYVLQTPVILTTSLVAFVVNACVAATIVALPFLAEQGQHGALGLGWMQTGMSIGGALGAILFSLFAIRNPTPKLTLLACLLEGVMFLLMGLTGHLWLLVGLMLFVGLAETAVNTIAPSVNQSIIPPRLIGRVISVLILMMSSSDPLAKGAAGLLLDQWDAKTMFLLAGAIQLLVVCTAFLLPAIRNFDRHRPSSHNVPV